MNILVAINPLRKILSTPCPRRKRQRLTNRQLRKVHVNLGGIDSITAMRRMHLLCRDPLIIEVRPLSNINPIRLTGKRLQKRRTPRPRRTQHNTHLPSTNQPIELGQDIDARLPSRLGEDTANHAREREPDIRDILLEIGGRAIAEDVEVLEAEPDLAEVLAAGGCELGDGFGPGAGVEGFAVGVEGRVWVGVGEDGGGVVDAEGGLVAV